MLRDSAIAPLELHVTNLAFAEIFKHTISAVSITVAVLEPFFARDENYQWVFRGRNDAALLLTAEPEMDVFTATIDAAYFKSPTHLFLGSIGLSTNQTSEIAKSTDKAALSR
jgi:hypothetical protein